MSTYTVQMKVTFSIDDELLTRALKKATALGKSLDQLVSDYLTSIVGVDAAERSIREFKRLSGKGHSQGWRFNRGEIHGRS